MWGRLSTVLLASMLTTVTLVGLSSENSVAQDGAPRKVMLELITATWCASCPYADEAADELSMDYGPERLTVLQYHVSLDGLETPETDERRDDYDADQTGLPAAWFDGTEGVHSVGEPDTQFFYDLYDDAISDGLEIDSPITITATITELSDEFSVTASFGKAKNIVPPSVLHARYVLFENLVTYDNVVYNYVVRDIEIKDFDYEALPYNEQVTFGIQGAWVASNMGVAVFVQADTNGDVLQSANAFLGPKPAVTITSDIEGKEITSTTRVEGTATGNVDHVMVRIDGGHYKKAIGNDSWYIEIDSNDLDEGSHTLQVRGYSDSLVYTDIVEAEFTSTSESQLWLILLVIIILVVLLIVVLLFRRKERE